MKAMLAVALLMAATLHAGDYQQDYATLKAKVGMEHLEQYLAEWRKREPDNPDAWILSANWALDQADSAAVRSAEAAALPAGNYKLEMRNGKIVVLGVNGKPAGDIVPDPAQAGIVKAAWFISEGLKKWPHRADMHCGLATVYARGEFWPEHVAALRGFVNAARSQAGKLRWCHDEPLSTPEDAFLADKLHSFAHQQFELEDNAANQRFFEIAQITARACPKSPKGYSDLAVFHGRSKNWKAAQPVLEKAAEVAPDDALVWMNLGDNSQRLGKADAARNAYQHVIDLNSDASLVKDAQARMEAMDKAKP
jgi:tetratricopeptide (TPR) repeat protein